jgi:hypothetical protein
MSWRRSHAVVAAVAVVTTSLAAACIIADPSTDFPVLPERRPTILRDRAVPPISNVLGEFPPSYTFVVDVEADPTSTIAWHLFIDYDDLHPNGPPAGLIGSDRILPDKATPDAGVRTISLVADRLDTPPDLTRCHVIEALVGLGFLSDQDHGAHAFDSRGGDSIVWFYSPSGDLSGCPVWDGGLDGGFPPPPDALAGPG